jgi:hypothetical protein
VARGDRRRMMRRGSIPLLVHGLIEYGVGVLSIAAPSLFSFESDGATVVSILVGAGILVHVVVTRSPAGLVRSFPLDSHIVIDYVLSLFLIASPFIFGFSDDGAALAYFLILGVAFLLMSVMTRYHKPQESS